MNYLGHAYLSYGKPELLVGNLLGDYVKGSKILDTFPAGIKEGILLHRKIDEYTDKHIANSLAKNYFRADYQLYAGAFVDTLYDHYLANDPRHFNSEKELEIFAAQTYKTIQEYWEIIPEQAKVPFHNMIQQNWLYNYRTVKGIQKAFDGLVRKAEHLSDSSAAYRISIQHYYELNQRYYEFIDDVEKYVKSML